LPYISHLQQVHCEKDLGTLEVQTPHPKPVSKMKEIIHMNILKNEMQLSPITTLLNVSGT